MGVGDIRPPTRLADIVRTVLRKWLALEWVVALVAIGLFTVGGCSLVASYVWLAYGGWGAVAGASLACGGAAVSVWAVHALWVVPKSLWLGVSVGGVSRLSRTK